MAHHGQSQKGSVGHCERQVCVLIDVDEIPTSCRNSRWRRMTRQRETRTSRMLIRRARGLSVRRRVETFKVSTAQRSIVSEQLAFDS